MNNRAQVRLADTVCSATSAVKPAIFLFVWKFLDGGLERSIQQIANYFAERDYYIEVLSCDVMENPGGRKNPAIEAIEAGGATFSRISTRGRMRLLQVAWQLAARAKGHRYPLFVGHGSLGNLVAVCAKKLSFGRARAIIRFHDSAEFYDPPVTRGTRVLMRYALPSAEAAVAVSDSVAADSARYFHIERSRIETIYDSFNLNEIIGRAKEPADPDPAEFGPYIVACGRMVRLKRFDDLLKAFAIVRQHSPLKLLILGDGPGRDDLVKCAAEYGVAPDLIMPGFRANPWPYISRAKALVVSSSSEAFSRVVVEAMGACTPVISSRCGGPEESLDGGRYGLLYDVGDVEELARCIRRMLDDPETAREFGRRGQERALDFSNERIMPALEKLYVSTAVRS